MTSSGATASARAERSAPPLTAHTSTREELLPAVKPLCPVPEVARPVLASDATSAQAPGRAVCTIVRSATLTTWPARAAPLSGYNEFHSEEQSMPVTRAAATEFVQQSSLILFRSAFFRHRQRNMQAVSLLVVALILVPCRSVASACTLAPGYEIEPNRDAPARPGNAQLRYWHGYDAVVSFTLNDAQGRSVPAQMVITPIPSVAVKGLPIYDGRSFFTTVEPFGTLTPGAYEMAVGRSRHRVNILATEDRAQPAVVANARARVITSVTDVGYRPNCEMISEPREFLELSFDAPREKGLLYEVTWSAALTPTRGLRAERSSDRRVFIRIPVGWFGDVSTDRSPAAIDLRAVDSAGNRSRATHVRLPALPPPPGERRAFPDRPTPLPKQQAIDLARFTRAAASDDARDAFALLSAVEPSPGDSHYDTEFRKNILSRGQIVTLQATVTGAEGGASVLLPVRIQGGRAAPVLSAPELRLLIASFPVQNRSVTNITLHVWPDRTVDIGIDEGQRSRRLLWRPEEDPLGWAAEHGALAYVRHWIDGGGNVEGRAGAGSLELTPLMRASQAGQADVVRFLLEHGANPNAQTKEGGTALSVAAAAGHAEIVGMLLDQGADATIRHLGWHPLWFAAFNGRTEAVVLLLSRGTAPDTKVDSGGRTALMIAAGGGHTETVKALLDHGANINATTDDGRTALMDASGQGKPEVLRALLDRNPDISAQARGGRTAMWSAIARGSADVVQLLIEAKADVNQPGENGESPLTQARKRPISPASQRIIDLLIGAGARESQ